MGITMDADELMSELGVENTGSSEKMVAYLTDCGGFDVVSFESESTNPKICNDKAIEYTVKVKEEIDPTKIMVVREGAKVWLYLMEFYYKLNDVGGEDES